MLRVLAGPLAGASKMPYRRFLAANVAGAVVWAATIGALGFFFGKPVAAFLGHLGVWAFVALAAFLVLHFSLKHRRLRGRAPRGPSATTEAGLLTESVAKPVAARAR